jgi:hypothetical protein
MFQHAVACSPYQNSSHFLIKASENTVALLPEEAYVVFEDQSCTANVILCHTPLWKENFPLDTLPNRLKSPLKTS